MILKFGGYGFNKAHSTATPSRVSDGVHEDVLPRRSTWRPCSRSRWASRQDGRVHRGMQAHGHHRQRPDINISGHDFTVVKDKTGHELDPLRPGRDQGVGDKAVAAIITAREGGGPFKSIFDFCERVELGAVNHAALEALVKAGAFDSTGATRRALIDILDDAIRHGQARPKTAAPARCPSSAARPAAAIPRPPPRPSPRSPTANGTKPRCWPTRRPCWASTSPATRSPLTNVRSRNTPRPPPPT